MRRDAPDAETGCFPDDADGRRGNVKYAAELKVWPPVRRLLRGAEAFFRLLFGDTSTLAKPDLTPLGRVPTVDELLRGRGSVCRRRRPLPGAFGRIETFFRLVFGDTSTLPRPDLTPLGRAPTVDELLHGVRRVEAAARRCGVATAKKTGAQ